MKLAEWKEAVRLLQRYAQAYGHSSIPLPLAMSALKATSRPTMFRRMEELREVGFWVAINGDTFQILAAPDPVIG